MAQKRVAETPSPAKSKALAKNSPRLHVVVSDPAATPGVACNSSQAVFAVAVRELAQADRENFMVLHLDSKRRLLAKETISIGSLSAAIVHPREVFKGAILNPDPRNSRSLN